MEIPMSEETAQTASTETATETTEATPTITYANNKFTNVGDLEKSYLELQSTFSKKMGGFEGAPEEYTFRAEGFEPNDMTNTLGEWGKENSLSNDGINSLYSKLSELDAKKEEAWKVEQDNYIKAEMEKLGANAETRIRNAKDWLNANGGEGASDKLDLMAAGAEGLQIIENIIKASQGARPTVVPAQEQVTREKVNAMQFAKDQYGNNMMDNPQYAAKVRELRSQLIG